MDLGGWNAEFDPNLLGEWAEGVDTSQRTSSDKDDNGEDDPLTSALPVFTDDDPAISEQSLGDTGECEQKQDESSSLRPVPQHATYNSASAMSLAEHAAAISETASVLSARDERSAATGSSGGSSSRNNNSVNHPLAISSSASCPPPGSATMGHAPGPPILHPPSTSSDLYSVDLSQALERSNLGVFGPMNAAVAVPVEGPPIATHNNNNHPHLSTLTNNFLLATSASLQPQPQTMQQTTASAPHTHHHNHHHSHHRQQHTASTNGGATKSSPKPAGGSQQPRHSQHGSTTSTRPAASSSTTSSSLPPFYLFGAPIELRANFMANQRKRGLPIECNDPNSFYYGETVNGYHPQQLLKSCMTNQQTAASLLQVGFDPTKHRHTHDPLPKMIDARHGNSRRSSKGGQQKNEREQKRAQKITELIEQLRGQIEESGWQVDGRSKFNILSKCAEYVKHMINSTTEKKEEVEKLKSDLEMKKRKADEKAMQESRSDPESVTSSLTSDTTGSRRSRNSGSGDNQSTSGDDKKRKEKDDDHHHESSSDSVTKRKKARVGEAATEESSGEGKSGSGSGGSGSGNGKSAQGNSIGKTISTVSDLTDSNRCTSSNNSGSVTESGETDEIPEQEAGGSGEVGEQPSSSSISSDAAVASEKTSRGRHSGHKDVVFKNDKRSRKRPPAEVTSLERSFELDYEEVFDKSNIPQLIATTSGKIITWNECFVKATGYHKSEIERLTIFSLVRPDKLSNFFDIVAAALRPHDDKGSEDGDSKPASKPAQKHAEKDEESKVGTLSTEPTETDKSEKTAEDEVKEDPAQSEDTESKSSALPSRLMDYTAITLPCVDFPAMKKRNQAISDSDSLIDPLTVTVTLMGDKDPRKRCFHCVFTNCRGTDGALGSITPELLASLFSTPLRRRKKHLPSGRKHKRMRMTDEQAADDEFQPPPPRPPKCIGGPPEDSNEADTARDEAK